jgi:hypothetical protein
MRRVRGLAPSPRRRALALAGGLALVATAVFGPAQALAQSQARGMTLERRVKAAFLYKFLGYTEFPASAFPDPAAPVTIMVAGSDEMVGELVSLTAGRTAGNRPIMVRAMREGDAATLAHLLFVAGTDCSRVGHAIRAARALLVVTECDGGLQLGSAINFRLVDGHVRFDVSLDAAEKNNVRLSSRLLAVANHVQRGAS